MQISLIIPTKDRSAIIQQTLERALEAIDGIDAEIIIINDSETTVVEIPVSYQHIKVVRNNGKGVASARNLGASIAKSSLLWFLDDDMWINRSILDQAFALHEQYPNAVFNFNWVYPSYLQEEIIKTPFGRFLNHIEFTTMKGWCRGSFWSDDNLFTTESLAGATLLITAEQYKRVKGYDASFPFAGFEDHDFSARVRKAGIQCFIEPRFIAMHNEVNKTSLKGFLQRTFNNAVTKRHAVKIGYKDQELRISSIKKIIYTLLFPFQSVIISLLKFWPESKTFDGLYFKICQVMIGMNIYKGYVSIS